MGSDSSANNSSNDIIETYVQRLLAWNEPLTAATLKSLAEDAGLGDAEIAAVQEKAQAHLKRGKNYLNFDCIDDAIEELTQAAALSPLSLEILHSLSKAYAARYQKQHAAVDKNLCITTAKRCLDIEPEDTQALTIITSLDAKPDKPIQPTPKLKNRLLKGALIGILPVFALSYFLINNNRPYNPSNNATQASNAANTNVAAEIDIPIELNHPGLKLQIQQSRLSNYQKSAYYTFHGSILNESDQEIDQVKLDVVYENAAGDAIATTSATAIEDYTPPLRPGDSHSMHLVKELNPSLANVRLGVATIDQLPAAIAYAPETPIDYEWGFTEPTHLNFVIASRTENVNSADAFVGNWVVINNGETAIRELTMEIDFYDTADKIIATAKDHVAFSSYAAIMPGERWPFMVYEDVSENYSYYKVTITEAE